MLFSGNGRGGVTTRKFKQIITIFFVLLVFPFCFYVKAVGELIDWNKDRLRSVTLVVC